MYIQFLRMNRTVQFVGAGHEMLTTVVRTYERFEENLLVIIYRSNRNHGENSIFLQTSITHK